MPRQPRYFLPGCPVHVIARGVNRATVFFEDSDYLLYLAVIRSAAEKHGCAIHAYVLMTNHVHLLMTPDTSDSIPRVFQAVGRGYVQTINRKYGRTGTLWEGRYRTSLVESEAYALTCYRYIELNPVRAGIAAGPETYPYSSYRCNALGKFDPMVAPHETYLRLGADAESRHVAYRELFSKVIDDLELEAIRGSANACGVLGTDRFKDEVEGVLGESVRPGSAGRPRRQEYVAPRGASKLRGCHGS